MICTELTYDNIHKDNNDEGGDADVDVVTSKHCGLQDSDPVVVTKCSK